MAPPTSNWRRCAVVSSRSALPSDAGTTTDWDRGAGGLAVGGAAVGALVSQAATPRSVANSSVLRFKRSKQPSWRRIEGAGEHRPASSARAGHMGFVRENVLD